MSHPTPMREGDVAGAPLTEQHDLVCALPGCDGAVFAALMPGDTTSAERLTVEHVLAQHVGVAAC